MSIELAKRLLDTGRSHAFSSCLLYRAAIEHAEDEGFKDPEADAFKDPVAYAFKGPNSLSIQYLLGLGLELMLKSAIVAWDTEVDAEYLRKTIGHDLIQAIDEAEKRGFASEAPHLRELLEVLHEPFKQHWFRYERPDQFKLPGDFDQVVEVLTVLESEIGAKLHED